MSRVDWDLLADHLGGALAGTPEGERVAGLLATDPAWADAAARLSAALAAVDADLRALPPVPAMPDDVATRIEAVLAAPYVPDGAVPPGSGRLTAGSAALRPLAADLATAPAARLAVPAPPDGRPAARAAATTGPGRRRRTGWGAGLAVAAGVVAFAAIGLGPLGLLDDFSGFTTFSGDDGAGADAPAPALAEEGAGQADSDGAAGGPLMVVSGAEYGPDSFLGYVAPAAPDDRQDEGERGLSEEDTLESATPPPPLDRIWADPQPCLAAVAEVHRPAPVTVHRMDFATFEDQPAVVMWVTTGDGAEWVWVAGPDCGTAADGADGRHQAKVR